MIILKVHLIPWLVPRSISRFAITHYRQIPRVIYFPLVKSADLSHSENKIIANSYLLHYNNGHEASSYKSARSFSVIIQYQWRRWIEGNHPFRESTKKVVDSLHRLKTERSICGIERITSIIYRFYMCISWLALMQWNFDKSESRKAGKKSLSHGRTQVIQIYNYFRS